MFLSNGLAAIVLPLHWLDQGYTLDQVGRIGAALYAGTLLGGLAAPGLIARLDMAGGIWLGTALKIISLLGCRMGGSPAVSLTWRAVDGVALAILTLVIESSLNQQAGSRRDRVLGLYMVILYGAQSVGASLPGMWSEADSPWLMSGLLLFCAPPLWLAVGGWSPMDPVPSHPSPNPLRTSSPVVVHLAGVVAGAVLGGFYTLAPLHGADLLGNPRQGGMFMAAAMLGGMIGLWPLGVVAERVGHGRMITLLHGAIAVSALFLAWTHDPHPMTALAGAAVFGVAAFSAYPLASAAINTQTADHHRHRANGRLIVLSGLGGCLGPVLAAKLVPYLGNGAVFAVISGLTAFLAVLSHGHRRRCIPQARRYPGR